jgi:hypothetical protein
MIGLTMRHRNRQAIDGDFRAPRERLDQSQASSGGTLFQKSYERLRKRMRPAGGKLTA